MMLPSNEALCRLGERLSETQEQTGDIAQLEEYRRYRCQGLDAFFASVANVAAAYPSVSSCRIKRIDTIIRKLRRLQTMNLPQMDDIVGFRTIAPSLTIQTQLVRAFCEKLPVRRVRDYVNNVPADGYRAIHIVLKHTQALPGAPAPRVYSAELQVRTYFQQLWATTSESFGEQVKEGGGSEAQRAYLHSLSELIQRREEAHPDQDQIRDLRATDTINFYIVHFDKRRGSLISCDFFDLNPEGALDRATYLEQRHRADYSYESVLIGVTSGEKELGVTHLRYFSPRGIPGIPEELTPIASRP